ncbi:MAG: FdtA/QdtA family cupin domain-containing protein [bacterium]|nr:FdtA/QdtA family cupin domain-containing protein [bacterium]
MAKPLYKIIVFPLSDTKNGTLAMFQTAGAASKKIPFPIRKVLATTGIKGKDRRGAHAHFKTKQFLIAVTGGCTVLLDDGKRKASVKLTGQNVGLLLYPLVWHDMRDFKPNTTLLVIADRPYDEKRDYIRDYAQFLKVAQKQKRI